MEPADNDSSESTPDFPSPELVVHKKYRKGSLFLFLSILLVFIAAATVFIIRPSLDNAISPHIDTPRFTGPDENGECWNFGGRDNALYSVKVPCPPTPPRSVTSYYGPDENGVCWTQQSAVGIPGMGAPREISCSMIPKQEEESR